MDQPYRGLQPYTEADEGLFFGRDAEKAILIDKILTDKLTLLFAASGVGKSSLLQAAVMPELKRPNRENLDVVYYNDWVTSPLQGLTHTILETLQERSKINASVFPGINAGSQNISDAEVCQRQIDPAQEDDPSLQGASASLRSEPGVLTPGNLHDILTMCTTFTSEPFVIILDQFEEFFQYQRYTVHFTPFIAQLSDAIRDRATPVTFLISMREDFALNLNAFKGHLPTMLFENYFRLEKLELMEAKAAIEQPVQRFGFRYEQGLLDDLLKDLADQERESRIGAQKEVVPENAPAFVEPPNVQIVCSQLWDLEKGNPAKVIRARTYRDQGGARGFVNVYFKRVIEKFSPHEKSLASKAFDHLVTPRGTKMAYPVPELGAKLHVTEHALSGVLARLEKARILRSQERKGELWYELYHDIFSGIISQWNTGYKAKQRAKRTAIGIGIATILVLLCVTAYDITMNLTNYHLRLSPKGFSDQIELWRGSSKSWDVFKIAHYTAETPYKRNQVEVDKQFLRKPVSQYTHLTQELIGDLPIVDRISTYWEVGEVEKALELADKSITDEDITRSYSVISSLGTFRSQQAFDVLKRHLFPLEQASIKSHPLSFFSSVAYAGIGSESALPPLNTKQSIISTISSATFHGVDECLVKLLDDKDSNVRKSAVEALSYRGNIDIVERLIPLFENTDSTVKAALVNAFVCLGNNQIVLEMLRSKGLINDLLEYWRERLQQSAPSYLPENDPLTIMLPFLTRLDADRALAYLVDLAETNDTMIAQIGINALTLLVRDEEILNLLRQKYKGELLPVLTDQIRQDLQQVNLASISSEYSYIRQSSDIALKIDRQKTISLFVEFTQDQNKLIRHNAIRGLNSLINTDEEVLIVLDTYRTELLEALEAQIHEPGDPYYQQYLRNAAIKLLFQIDQDKAAAELFTMMASQEIQTQNEAIELIVTFRNDETFRTLLADRNNIAIIVRNLRNQINATIQQASEASFLRSPYLPYYSDTLGTVDINDAVGLLLAIDREQSIEWLSGILTEQNPFMRYVAAIVLLQIENPYQREAQQALGVLLNEVAPSLKPVIAQAFQYITFANDTTIMSLIAMLRTPELTASIQTSITSALIRLNSPISIEPLAALLEESEPAIRAIAVNVLGQLTCVDTTAFLLNALNDRDEIVRVEAIYALKRRATDDTVIALKKINQDSNKDMEESITSLLGISNQPENTSLSAPTVSYSRRNILSIAPISNVYFDEHGDLHIAGNGYFDTSGIWQFSEILVDDDMTLFEDDRLGKSLITLLDTENDTTRFDLAIVLGKLSISQAIPELKTLYENIQQPVIEKTDIQLFLPYTYPNIIPPYYYGYNPANVSSYWGTPYKQRDQTELKLAVASALLSLGQEDGLAFIQQLSHSKHDDIRKTIAGILGLSSSEQGNSILGSLLADQNPDVRIQAIMSVGLAHVTALLPELYKLVGDPNPQIRQTIIEALGKIASSESIEVLRKIALQTEEVVTIRIAAIEALGNMPTQEAVSALLEILDKVKEHYYGKTVIALGKTRSKQALPKLLALLRAQEHRKAQWRKIRDENTENYTDAKMDDWRKRLEAFEPQPYMESELARSIAMVDPDGEGVKLLSHDLAKVRKGSWMGLTQLPLTKPHPFALTDGPAAVQLIERLDRERMESKNPLFRHAAYRAIDGLLITIETYGGAGELAALEKFSPTVQDQEGVLTRVAWTIDRLREREENAAD